MSLPADRPRSEPLLPRIAAGEDAAVRECIDCYGGLVWSLARRFCPSAADAEDAVQEIFIDLWRSAGRFRAHIGSETLFVATIARRRLIDRLRRHSRAPASDPMDLSYLADPDAAQAGERASEAALAAKAIGNLPEDQRRVLVLGIVEGRTHSEIAEHTGLPLGTVKTHIRRGLVRVRDAMQAGVNALPAGGREQ